MVHNAELSEESELSSEESYDDGYDEGFMGPAFQIGPAEFAVAIRLYSAEYSHNHDASWFRKMLRLHNEQVLVACYANLT